MNHSTRQKNLNMTNSRMRSVRESILNSLKKYGYVVTTLGKYKAFKPFLQSNLQGEKIFSARVGFRAGDGATLVKMVTEKYFNKKNNAKSNQAK